MLQTYFVSGLRDPIWTVKFIEAEMTKYIQPVLPREIFVFLFLNILRQID